MRSAHAPKYTVGQRRGLYDFSSALNFQYLKLPQETHLHRGKIAC